MLLRRHGLINVARLKPCRALSQWTLAVTRQRTYATSSSEPEDVAILGGGITGLASAYYLSQSLPNTKITIYEAGSRIGGWLSSKSVEVDDGTIVFEAGPRTLRPNGNGVLAIRLIHELGMLDETIVTFNGSPAAINRYLYYPDHLVRLPNPKHGFLNMAYTLFTEPAFSGLFWRLATEALYQPRKQQAGNDESIGSFFSRRFGANMVDRLLSAVIHGIYAGDAWQLSAKSLFPTQYRDELEQGSVMEGIVKSSVEGPEMTSREADFMQAMKSMSTLPTGVVNSFKRASVFTFRRGLTQLVEALSDKLRARGNVKFITNAPVEAITFERETQNMTVQVQNRGSSEDKPEQNHKDKLSPSHTHIISCLAPGHLSKIVADPALSGTLNSIPAVTVMTVSLYFRTPNLHPPGFGYLIPLGTPLEQNPERALGVVFDTSYSADSTTSEDMQGPLQDTVSARGTKLTVMLGGHYWSGWPVFPSEDEGKQMARSILERHLGITEEPAAISVNLQADCIPQYTVGHEDRVKSIHQKILTNYAGKLRVAGNWYRGVGVNDCLRSAWDVVQELRDAHKTGLEVVAEDKKYVRLQFRKTKVKEDQ